MVRSRLLAMVGPLLFASAALASSAPTLDELVARNVQAHGGTAALQAMHNLRVSGKLLVNDGQFVLAFTQIVGRGAKVRTEASVQGMTLVQAYDGKGGWQINPFMGRRDPERLSVDDSKALVELAADFDGSLFDAPLKGNRLEYLGVEDVDGTPAHKIKLTRGNGDVEYVYLDPDHYLEIRVLSQRTEQGVTVENETNLGDYEKIAGVYVPFAVESGRKGSTDRQRLMLDKAEVNVNVDPAVFAFPAAPAQAAK